MWSTINCPICTFTLIFTFHPCWIIIFWSLKRGDCSISQLKNWLCQKAKRPISHVMWDFSPVVWPFSESESIYVSLPHSLPKNVGVWTRSHIKKKCFLPFQYFHTILQQKYWSFKYSISIQSNDSSQDCRVVRAVIGWKMRCRHLKFRCTAVRLCKEKQMS
jgi:hypothetical protein